MNIIGIVTAIYVIMLYKLKIAHSEYELMAKAEKILIVYRFINVVRFVISLILYHFIETSDLDKYDDFLDCRNVRKNFFKKFSVAEDFRKLFYVYLALEIAKQGIERLNQNFGIELEKPPEMPIKNKNNESLSNSIPI